MKMKNFPWFHFLVFNPLLPVTVEHQSLKIWIREYPVQAVSDLILNDIYPSSVKAESDTKGSCGVGRDVGYEQTETKLHPRKGPNQISEAPIPSNLQMGNCL